MFVFCSSDVNHVCKEPLGKTTNIFCKLVLKKCGSLLNAIYEDIKHIKLACTM